MSVRPLLVGLALALVLCLGAVVPGLAQERPRLPSDRHATLRADDEVPLRRLSFDGADTLRAQDARRRDRVGPYRYGTHLDAQYTPAQDGVWERLPSGDWVWRLRIHARDATSLSVGLPRFALPPGAQLFLHGPDGSLIRGPYTDADATRGQLWTPLVRSETLTLISSRSKPGRSAVTTTASSVSATSRSNERETIRDIEGVSKPPVIRANISSKGVVRVITLPTSSRGIKA